ncbi:MAG: tetratricopeptide repeat protein [Gammaproteobacteria bacterium]
MTTNTTHKIPQDFAFQVNHAIRNQDWLLALKLLKQGLNIRPEDPLLHNNLGNIYLKISDFDKAKQHFHQALRIEPLYIKAYNNLGIAYYKSNDSANAEKYLKEALRLEPGNLDAHFNLALNFSAQSLWESAKQHYEALLKINPSHPNARQNLGLILINEAQEAENFENFEKFEQAAALLEGLDNADAQYFLGNAYLALGHLDAAETAYRWALDSNPDYHDACHNLAIILIKKNQHSEAKNYFEKALKLNAGNITADFMLQAILGDRENNQHNNPNNNIIKIPEQAPLPYVQDLFDQYAPYYNRHLKCLNYQTPYLMRACINPHLPFTCEICLDLGCGTGLSGLAFQDAVRDLIGLDISANMLAEAKKLNIYKNLIQDSIIDFLEKNLKTQAPETKFYNLILATEVLIYFGDLGPIFKLIQENLKPRGLFCFSIEIPEVQKTYNINKPSYVLQKTGRYQHNPDYISKLAENNNFKILKEDDCELRKHHEISICGKIYVVQKY